MAAEAKAQAELQDIESLFSLEGKVAVVVCCLSFALSNCLLSFALEKPTLTPHCAKTGGSRGLGLHAASGYTF